MPETNSIAPAFSERWAIPAPQDRRLGGEAQNEEDPRNCAFFLARILLARLSFLLLIIACLATQFTTADTTSGNATTVSSAGKDSESSHAQIRSAFPASRSAPYNAATLNCGGFDDTSAVQSTLDNLHASGGGTAQLPSNGTCTIHGALKWYSSVALAGNGSGSVLKLADGVTPTVHMIDIQDGLSDIEISNLTIDGNVAHEAGVRHYGIYALGVKRLRIHHVTLRNIPQDAISVSAARAGAENTDIIISDVIVNGFGRNGIALLNKVNGVIVANTSLIPLPGSNAAIDIEPSALATAKNISLSGVIVSGGPYQIAVMGEAAIVDGVTISHCLLRNAKSAAIYVSDAHHVTTNSNIITDDSGSPTGQAIRVISRSSTLAKGIVLHGDQISGMAGANGMVQVAGSTTYRAQDVSLTDISISGGTATYGLNVLYATGVQFAGSRVYDGASHGVLFQKVTNGIVSNSSFRNNVGRAIYLVDSSNVILQGNVTNSNGYGFYASSGTGYIVTGNQFALNQVASFIGSSTVTGWGNDVAVGNAPIF